MDALERLANDAATWANEHRRPPGATYRLQFHAGFTLRDATALVPYFHDLGVTHLYASPFLTARPGSTHGYDVVDHGHLNPEVGTEQDLAALAAALHERGMGLILDVVPNHMCVTGNTAWWADVLEHGPSSAYAGHFDIAWFDSPRPGMQGRLLLPILGEPYGQALENGTFVPAIEDGRLVVRCYDLRLPIDPRTYGLVLNPAVERLRNDLGPDHADVVELQSILNSISHLPPRGETDPARAESARVECAALRRRLSELKERFPSAAQAGLEAVEALAGKPGDPGSWGALDALLEAQAYRPCFWRVATDEINYRRFFDVNELAALSVEREDVFRAVHQKWLGWAAEGTADGLRIDHPDGLFEPRQYLDRLQLHYLLAIAKRLCQERPEHYRGLEWDRDEPALLERLEGPARQVPLYVVVEKILGDGEQLPEGWACQGTTGYELINTLNGLFVDGESEEALTGFYQRFSGMLDAWSEVVYEKKVQILRSSLASELTALAHQLDRLARLDRRSRDFTLTGLRRALREVIACFPVYRSYVAADGPTALDTRYVLQAITRGRRRDPSLGRDVFHFIRDTVLMKDPPGGPPVDDYRELQRRFAGKFQQVTSPVTAKGVEDTGFYVFNRLASLNEVGGEPGRFGRPPEQVHAFLASRPAGMCPLSTHDTKRGEDVRARLNVLSELPGEWAACVNRWAGLNRPHKTEVEELPAPGPNEEWLLYQTLVGLWPDGEPDLGAIRDRVQAYMTKAMREAKVHSSWINPDAEYEQGVMDFIAHILAPDHSPKFLADLAAFSQLASFFGRINSLAQSLVRCTAPGVPDVYQGTEDWDDSLVDPDNRRPVDYERRKHLLAEAGPAGPSAKLFVVSRALRFRRERAALFAEGDYDSVTADGKFDRHVFAFLRTKGDEAALVVVPRLCVALLGEPGRLPLGEEVWRDTTLPVPGGRWRDVFTGAVVESSGRLPVGDVLSSFPVSLLARE